MFSTYIFHSVGNDKLRNLAKKQFLLSGELLNNKTSFIERINVSVLCMSHVTCITHVQCPQCAIHTRCNMTSSIFLDKQDKLDRSY